VVTEEIQRLGLAIGGLRVHTDRSQRGGLIAVAGLAALAGWLTLPGLTIEGQPEQLARGVEELGEAEYAEQKLGSSGEISIRLQGDDLTDPAVLAWTREARERLVLEFGDQVRPILSTADLFAFLGEDPEPTQIDAAIEIMPEYLTSAVLERNRSEALAVFGVKLRDVNETRVLLNDMERTLPPAPPGVEVELVGLPVAAAQGLDLVSDDGWLTSLAGIGLALAVVAIGLRRVGEVARAALTMLLASGWIAGIVALTTGTLNPLTVAIGSLATATSCEFAIMLARAGGRGTLRGVGTAALAALVGYSVLGFSQLAVLRDFGLLLATSVGCSFVAASVAVLVIAPRRAPVVPESLTPPRVLEEAVFS
jgi:predicted RND superfamily exporter protein